MRDQRQFVSAHKDELLRVMQKFHLENIRIFGSVARGDYREDSDIDFLVRSPIDFYSINKELKSELSKVMGEQAFDVISDDYLARASREKAFVEAILLQDCNWPIPE